MYVYQARHNICIQCRVQPWVSAQFWASCDQHSLSYLVGVTVMHLPCLAMSRVSHLLTTQLRQTIPEAKLLALP